MLTFELLRFLADLSAGLTGSVAATGGEDCCDCETWNNTFNNMKVKLCSRELLSWDPIKDDFQVCHYLTKICKIFNIKSAHLGTAALFGRLVCWLWWVCSSRSSLRWELSLQYFWWARDENLSKISPENQTFFQPHISKAQETLVLVITFELPSLSAEALDSAEVDWAVAGTWEKEKCEQVDITVGILTHRSVKINILKIPVFNIQGQHYIFSWILSRG